MAVVHKAMDLRLNREVAIKFLPPTVTSGENARARLHLEAQAAAGLDHVNIGTIYALERTDAGQLFIVMAYYRGQTVEAMLRQGPSPLDRALDITVQTARGLQHAHQAGIVHRDIKPANLMLTEDGLVKILDFGLAKLKEPNGRSQDGTIMGTMEYMSPEQARGQPIDPRADLWALGVVLYQMLSGVSPFQGEGGMASTPASHPQPQTRTDHQAVPRAAAGDGSAARTSARQGTGQALRRGAGVHGGGRGGTGCPDGSCRGQPRYAGIHSGTGGPRA